MKIGIVTSYYKNYNYGGQLQAYALQRTINDFGYNTELISFYRSKGATIIRRIKKMNTLQLCQRFVRKARFKRLLQREPQYRERNRLFDEFADCSPHSKVVKAKNLSTIKDEYDGFIVGSDNVWRPESAFDDAVFLRFALPEQFKISYAASIGVNVLTAREKKIFKEELEKFQFISVREKYSKELLEKLLHREVSYDVDPVVLFTKEAWIEVERPIPIKTGYVFEYLVDENENLKKQIHEFSKKKGLPVVGIPHSQGRYKKTDNSYIDIPVIECGPREWLYLIHHAEYVFTDSFHATVFSVVFQKNFWTAEKPQKEIPFGEGRQRDFLQRLGIDNRLIEINKLLSNEELDEPIEYSTPIEVLNSARKKSLCYLMHALKVVNQ